MQQGEKISMAQAVGLERISIICEKIDCGVLAFTQ